ncbi:hypothetical protein N7537_003824 [Penicillium hordei]|uniref:Uncharacterized protein n=1 Tax=Penicillium hordei TaxID=40994 RepID=A0AAD6EA37_9EURO|nr:uncharacterized protein N7537_003824 [Penicillium hordei]KAJ5607205.1 hypothetical protein N7537_003824 [Penicillium hordei]
MGLLSVAKALLKSPWAHPVHVHRLKDVYPAVAAKVAIVGLDLASVMRTIVYQTVMLKQNVATSFAGRGAPVGAILLTDRMYLLILQLETPPAYKMLGLVLEEQQVKRFTHLYFAFSGIASDDSSIELTYQHDID